MSELKIKDKAIVVPGEELAIGLDYLPNGSAFRENDKIIANQLGLISLNGNVIKVIPLTGKYIPKRDDVVIGRIMDVGFSNWFVNIDYAYDASLSVRDIQQFVNKEDDLSYYYDFNDLIAAKIARVTKSKKVDLTMKGPGLIKLVGGKIIKVTPNKVPRIIGKGGSMIDMIKTATKCKITVGQNGLVWIKGENFKDENKATEAIMKIEKDSHTQGLTDKIKAFLEK